MDDAARHAHPDLERAGRAVLDAQYAVRVAKTILYDPSLRAIREIAYGSVPVMPEISGNERGAGQGRKKSCPAIGRPTA
jgi:hypothetical protein